MSSKIGWDFPSTNGGKEDGLNDSGIAFFQSNPVKSLTREVIQDSLDARISQDLPADVEFELKFLDKKDIPGIEDLEEIFSQALNYYDTGESNETYEFFIQASEFLKKNKVPVLAIRDRNTSGLTKIDQTKNSHFHRLVKTTGDTGKTGTSHGSYGIGKHAPFAASKLRTMFYGTLNRDEGVNRAFQGVIKIASFDRGDKYLTQGTGFYGVKEGFKPLTDLSGLHPFFVREDGDFGTDKFVLGFDGPNNWKEIVIEESVHSYMCAILNEALVVRVGGTEISKDSLNSIIELIKEFNPESPCIEYYLTLTSENRIEKVGEFETEDGKTETVKLYLLPGETFKKKVQLVRGSGMKIMDKDRFRVPINFAGTLIVEGENLNKVFRKMEPPTHNDWDPELYKKNPKYARNLKRKLYEWLNKKAREIVPELQQESFELPGIANILPSLSQEEEPVQEIDNNVKEEKINSIQIVKSPHASPSEKKRKQSSSQGERKKRRLSAPKDREARAVVRSIRAFCCDPEKGMYRVIINSSKTGHAKFKVNLVGESLTEKAEIKTAKNEQTGEKISVNDNVIGPVYVDKSMKLTLTLDNVTRYSLEVIPE